MVAGPQRSEAHTPRFPLLSIDDGHPLSGANPPPPRPAAIETHVLQVAHALAWSRATLRECGFLAYARPGNGDDWAEDMSYGDKDSISWHWRKQQAVVGFSFHTHPGPSAACLPSGLDVMGAIVRGDHVHYVMTLDGRLTGWRFREPAQEARAILKSIRVLSHQRALTRPFLTFLECSLEAAMPYVVEPIYAARLLDTPDGPRFQRTRLRAVLSGLERRMHRFPELEA